MGLDNPLHIAFLLILLLLVFGAKRLPEMGRSLGSGMRGFKDSLSGEAAPEHEPVAAAAIAAPREPVHVVDERVVATVPAHEPHAPAA
ncbi:MAG TPA: twin-arginine translocase TatA/TatE family subunit [Solirubrobacteraceae bacterium]|jgi:sec-independent protein translocase protein TatA|nr:twin-arginine translocase TatA/TatE family subunit [Solirubrobacteraceae bacterium]